MGVRSILRELGARIGDMSRHGDLLRQARHLATKEPRRPLQASLRRAVSAAYYSLFHLLVDEAINRMISAPRDSLRDCLRRPFAHANMRKVAQQFARSDVSPKLSPGLDGQLLHVSRMASSPARSVILADGPEDACDRRDGGLP